MEMKFAVLSFLSKTGECTFTSQHLCQDLVCPKERILHQSLQVEIVHYPQGVLEILHSQECDR